MTVSAKQSTFKGITLRQTRRRDGLLIGLAGLGVLAYILLTIASGGAGFPLDDSWIHQVFARNLAEHGQWAFILGTPSAASTSPLWTVILALGDGLHVPMLLWAYALGFVALAAVGVIGARLAEQLLPDVPRVGLISGLLLVTAWHLLWAASAGMETILYCALSLTLIGLTWRELTPAAMPGVDKAFRRGLGVGVVGALLTLARPEGAGLVGLCGLLMLIARPQGRWRDYGAWAGGVLAAWLIVVLPDLLLNVSVNGTLLPDTSAAKQAENAPLLAEPIWQRVAEMLAPLSAGGQIILVPAVGYALYRLFKRLQADHTTLLFWLLPLWIAATVLLYAFRLPAPYQHGRYVMPILPLLIILGGVGLAAWIVPRYRRRVPRILSRTLFLTVILAFGLFWVIGASVYAQDVRLINGEMVTAAHWIAANIPADTPLATHDIGAVGYFAPRPLFDLAGLVSPEVIPIILQPEALMQRMQQRGIQYIMASPPQLPAVVTDPRLCPLYTTPGQPSPIHMTVYRIDWQGHCNSQ
jgi:hypothetical protein